MGRCLSLAPLTAALFVLFGTFSYAESPCETVVTERLNQLDIDMADVRSIFYTKRIQRRNDDSRVVGIDAWVNFHSCKGSLIIDMTRGCRVRQVYTRYKCEVPGIPNY